MPTMYELIKGLTIEQADRAIDFAKASNDYIEAGSMKKAKQATEIAKIASERAQALKFVLDDMPTDMGERVIE